MEVLPCLGVKNKKVTEVCQSVIEWDENAKCDKMRKVRKNRTYLMLALLTCKLYYRYGLLYFIGFVSFNLNFQNLPLALAIYSLY